VKWIGADSVALGTVACSLGRMRAYIGTTAILFGALTVVHAWRAVVEPSARDPWFFGITLVAAALCGWGARVWMRMRRPAP
jgi:hypothetical protein